MFAEQWSPKDPAEFKDYGFDWSLVLVNDQITASSWTASPDGLTISNASFTAKNSKFWVAGGIPNTIYILTNEITTQGGRIYERSRQLIVREL